MPKVNIISLGCSKNTVDSEGLAGALIKEGFGVEYNAQEPDFDYVLINTCGFIDKAKEESINTILNYVSFRKRYKKHFEVIVFGCLAQRYKEELQEQIPEIDKVFGLMQQKEILSHIKQNSHFDSVGFRKLSTPRHYAYIKISEGCDRHCSFCAIPMIRGRYASRSIEEIISEAEYLSKQGVKELILIAQDTSYYGRDLYKQNKLYDLLVSLCKVNVHWIRLQYSYPNQFPMEVLSLMQTEKKLCRYLDMPLQHINNRILESMNRHISSEEITALITKIRQTIPDIALRTTLIVGYPSEKKTEFEQLKYFINQVKFDRMGAFTYSKEEGTLAGKLRDNVSQKEKQKRLDELTLLQEEISLSLNKQKIGKIFEVIIDGKEGEYFVGRTQYDSPEVDNEILIKSVNNIKIGEFYFVKIISADIFDLYAEVV